VGGAADAGLGNGSGIPKPPHELVEMKQLMETL
jgi:hypothetical protein